MNEGLNCILYLIYSYIFICHYISLLTYLFNSVVILGQGRVQAGQLRHEEDWQGPLQVEGQVPGPGRQDLPFLQEGRRRRQEGGRRGEGRREEGRREEGREDNHKGLLILRIMHVLLLKLQSLPDKGQDGQS